MEERELRRLAKQRSIEEFMRQLSTLSKEERHWRAISIAEHTREFMTESHILARYLRKRYQEPTCQSGIDITCSKEAVTLSTRNLSLLPQDTETATIRLANGIVLVNLGRPAERWIDEEYKLFRSDYPTLPITPVTIFRFILQEKPLKFGYLPFAQTVSGVPIDVGYHRTVSSVRKPEMIAIRRLLKELTLPLTNGQKLPPEEKDS